MTQAILIYAKPFVAKGDLRIAIFNEIANSVYLYIDMLLTDFHGHDEMRENFGKALVLLLVFTVSINFIRFCSKILINSKLIA